MNRKSALGCFILKTDAIMRSQQILDLDEKKVKSYLQNGKRNLKLCLEEKNAGKR